MIHQHEIVVEGCWRERGNRIINTLKAEENQRSSENNGLLFELFLELQEAVHQNGDVNQFIDVLENKISPSSIRLSSIFDHVSPSGDSLLHDAVFLVRKEISELIIHNYPQLLTQKNICGDTSLHVASRSNDKDSIPIIEVILSEYENNDDYAAANDEGRKITRITNEYGNTCLHEAIYSKNLDGAHILFDADKHVAHYLNNSKVSPFYLAVQSSYGDLVGRWLQVQDLFPQNMDLPRCHGVSPLHAAISTKNADLLTQMVEKESYLRLINLRDEDGRTLIHFAAKTGFTEGVRLLLQKSSSIALELDMKGRFPIHLASKKGHVEVVKEFCEQEMLSLRGLTNNEGQNILHVAAKHGHESVVKYILRKTKLDVNQKDKYGNTPLHLAAKNLHYSVVLSLILDKRTMVNAVNSEGLTARDLVLLTKREIPKGVGQDITYMVLNFAGAKESGKAQSLLKQVEPLVKPEVMKNKMETIMIVAIILVAVTFIAGFIVPGGVYSSQDPIPDNRGTAILGHKPMFKIFAFFNMVSMYSSTFGSFFLLWAMIGNLSHSSALSYSLSMVGVALLSMTLSFMAALSLLVSTHVSWISSLTIFIGISSFCAILIGSNTSWSILVVCIMSRYRDECFKIFLSIISAISAVTLLVIVVSAPIMLLLYLFHVVH